MDLYLQRVQHSEMMNFWKRGDKDAQQNHAQTKAMRQESLFKALSYTPQS